MLDLVDYRHDDFPIIMVQNRSNWIWDRIGFIAASILATATTVGIVPTPLIYTCEITTATLFAGELLSILIEKIKKKQIESLTPDYLNCLNQKATFHLMCVPSKFIPHETQDEFEKIDIEIENDYCLNLSIETIWEDVFPQNGKTIWEEVFPQNRKTIEDNESYKKCKKHLEIVSVDKKIALCATWQKNVDNYIRFEIIRNCLNNFIPLFILIKDRAPSSKPFCLLFPPKEHELTMDELVVYYRSSLIHKIKAFPV